MKKHMTMEGNIPVIYFKEGRCFIAYSFALDLSACGMTLKKVEEAFAVAVELFLEELAVHGSFDSELRSLGWRLVKNKWTAPEFIAKKNKKVYFSFTQ